MLKTKTLLLMLLLTSCNNIVLEKVPPTKPIESIKPLENKVVEVKPSASNITSSSLPVDKKDITTSDKKETILVASPRPIPSSSSSVTSPNSPNLTGQSSTPTSQSRDGTPPPFIAPTPTPSSSYNYDYNEFDLLPISDTVKDGTINLTFKDDYRVRYDKTNKSFYSLANKDMSVINKVFSDYKITEVYDNMSGLTQEQADLAEKLGTEIFKYDKPNQASMYSLHVKDLRINDFVNKMRTIESVRMIYLVRTVPVDA